MVVKISKDPVKFRKYFVRNALLSTVPLGFFFYSLLKHQSVEKTIYDKYLGNVTMDGLKELLAGGQMSPHMLIQQEMHM